MSNDVNRNPRRWVDESGRVRVIEGWHPSRPSEVGYNLMVDGDWFGTFGSLEDAANSAGSYGGIRRGTVVLRQHPDPQRRRGNPTGATLHLAPPLPDED